MSGNRRGAPPASSARKRTARTRRSSRPRRGTGAGAGASAVGAAISTALVVIVIVSLVVLATVASRAPADERQDGPAPGVVVPPAPIDVGGVEPVPADRSIATLADPEWVAEVAGRTGIPIRPLSAYAGAALRLADEQPDCHVEWTTLAAIGRVETVHATIFDSALDERGRSTPGIIGIPLDGDDVLAVPDTDGGALDGDTVWDRAVGPMQFIPSTWALVGADGDGDGTADAQQIDDAVLSAARYLCRHGRDLAEPDDWVAAIRSYNPSTEYRAAVASFTERYTAAAGG